MKKKHGFTLIELIVVIAIIGVIAAILVPSMLGYVKRSRIMSSNTAAKSLYNAVNLALVELDTYDLNAHNLIGKLTPTTGAAIYAQAGFDITSANPSDSTQLVNALYCRISSYFSDVQKISSVSISLDEEDGSCIGVGVIHKNYPGTAPMAITVTKYDEHGRNWTSEEALDYAVSEEEG